MKAVVCHQTNLSVAESAGPGARARPGAAGGGPRRHLRLRPARPQARRPAGRPRRGDRLPRRDAARRAGGDGARVQRSGRSTTARAPEAWRPGTPVVSLPMIRMGEKVQMTGLSAKAPGAYAERVLVQESLTMDVPNGLAPETAALTEPMAVAWHAVRRSGVRKRQTAVVVGCGPIGLAVILMLKARGVRTVIASDFSPGRRALAEECGADVVIDPGAESPWTGFEQSRYITDANHLFDLALDTMGKLRKVPLLPWWQVIRAAEAAGATPTGPVVFECVGVPGIIDEIMTNAPLASRRRGGRRLHGAGHDPAGDGDQQGDRPAVRLRLPAARVPRGAAPDRGGQGRPDSAGHGHGRARRGRGRLRCRSATRRGTRRS